jgi:hypothetical protein
MLQSFDSYDYSVASSIAAIVLSQIALALNHNVMELITAFSAAVLALTALVKFIDLVIEKIPTWREKIRKTRKPKD